MNAGSEKSNPEHLYVRIVPLSGGGRIGRSLTYRVPEPMAREISIGTIVAVDVRKSVRIGIVTAFVEYDEILQSLPYAIKPLKAVYSDEILLTEKEIEVARWIAGYYACSLHDALSPFAPEIKSLYATTILTADNPGKFLDAISSLGLLFSRPDAINMELRPDKSARIPHSQLIDDLKGGSLSESGAEALIKKWIESGILKTEIGIRTRIRHLGAGSYLSISATARESGWGNLKSERQREVLDLLDQVGGTLSRDEIIREIPGSGTAIRGLAKKGFLEEIIDASLLQNNQTLDSDIDLIPAQKKAIAGIVKAMDTGKSRTFLLFGVTGSGKTEVYLEICRRAISHGKRATILVPEIALTYQTVRRFMRTFPGRVALLHSELTERERLHEWRAIRKGERDIVIGARSALFAPMPDRGVIVIDEESETAYKQHQRPKYHARETARRMSKIENSVLVLGSATPSVESFHAALTGTYTLLRLPARVVGGELPEVRIVRPELEPAPKKKDAETMDIDGREMAIGLMSSELREELSRTLAMKRQAILFLNLRGFAQSLVCPKCGWSAKCPKCEISLTYHRRERVQLCHHCGYRDQALYSCQRCGQEKLVFLGWGTERLEAEVRELFPAAITMRMDRDSVKTRGRRMTIVESMRKHEVDILLGTQMIAKGFDFPSVRLVGVISADQSLNIPDFRANERTYQLLTQVVGRAGRSDSLMMQGGGIAIIQSYNPDNWIIQTAIAQDFEEFYSREIILREKLNYPPATHLTRVIFSGKNRDAVDNAAFNFGRSLESKLSEMPPNTREDLKMLGPSPAPLEKIDTRWRFHCILKGKRVSHILAWLNASYRTARIPKEIKVEIDVDPIAML
ncbi:MAG: primosomal protein N' [bacterium]|nr:primosomal protein N' [bacterium]